MLRDHDLSEVDVVPAQAGVVRWAPPARCLSSSGPRAGGVVRVMGVARHHDRRGPRAGGGGPPILRHPGPAASWSPRRRGWSGCGARGPMRCGVVPAQAGVIRSPCRSSSPPEGGPRAGGGGPLCDKAVSGVKSWSPRRRGWAAHVVGAELVEAVVPAQAGVVRFGCGSWPDGCCGPRAGGGGPRYAPSGVKVTSWSPRRRGWAEHEPAERSLLPVVPAQAGVVRLRARA